MKKVIFLIALAFGMMSFTTSNSNKEKEAKYDFERCTRMCTYAVNTSTGERRLKGCTEWTCDGGTLAGIELVIKR